LSKGQAATHPSYEAYGYDQAGNQTFAQDADNRTTTTQYDGDNRAVQSVATASGVTGTTTITTTMRYDPNGNSVAQTTRTVDATSPGTVQTHTTTSAYNAADWEASSSVDGLTTSYTYDAAGQQIGTTTSDGQTATTLAYDSEVRVTSLAENAGGAGPYTTAYTYNANDLPLTLTYPRRGPASTRRGARRRTMWDGAPPSLPSVPLSSAPVPPSSTRQRLARRSPPPPLPSPSLCRVPHWSSPSLCRVPHWSSPSLCNVPPSPSSS
jgi:YD repeat-containing protein